MPTKTPARKNASKKPSVLPAKRYAALLRDARKLNDAAETAGIAERVRAYWKLGERIERERLAQNAGYHNSVLRDLSADSGIALRTLQRAVLFHAAYSKPPSPSSGLSWLHYRALVTVPSATERAHYESLARASSLSARQLEALIRAGQAQDPEAPFSLERPTSPSYLYAATLHSIVDGDTLVVTLDLGFEIFRRQRVRLARLDAPELDTAEGRRARDFVAARLLPARSIVIQTRRFDRYARYVAHLFYSERELSIDECFERGHYLNDELLANRRARLL